MIENSIVIGELTIAGNDILELTTDESASILLDEMASDACEAVVVCRSDYLDTVAYGSQVSIMRGPAIQNIFYLSKATRLTNDHYKLELTSFLGILDGETFYGGYYTGETFRNVIESIIQTDGLNPLTRDHEDMVELIEYDEGVDDLPIYGWIRVCTKKEAIHQVLFSKGISMKRSTSGIIMFTTLYETEPFVIAASETYQETDVTFLESVSEIEVAEHAYTEDMDAEAQVLFESEQATGFGKTYIAVFNADSPVLRNVSTSGIVILYRNCNAAIITGYGTITGYPTVHSQTMIRETIREEKGETITSQDCTLVTMQNSAFIIDRLKNYYLTADTEVGTNFIRGDEKVGNRVSVVNAFGERVTGFITKITETYSGIVKASCMVTTGYMPMKPDDGFTHYAILTGSGGWSVPSSVYEKDNPKVKVVLIGGGTGGYSGKAGEAGGQVQYGDTSRIGAAGGEGGYGGEGGKILSFTVDDPPHTLYYSCGSGGAGGAASSSHAASNAGSAGGNTTMTVGNTTFSSANGQREENGITNFISGVRYGLSNYQRGTAEAVRKLAKGGSGGKGFWTGQYECVTAPGSPTLTYAFDINKNPPSFSLIINKGGKAGASTSYGTGGSGGGAAAEMSGEAGANATSKKAGNGGKGADAFTVVPKPNLLKPTGFLPGDDGGYGDGGFGGFGGGGGGAGGTTHPGQTLGNGGAAGKGGAGGYGGDGCVIVYY